LLERVFHLQENQTTLRRELLAGLTTFMTMAYVVVVNPRILSEAGMPVEGVLFATCISSAVATLIMGLWANYPIALAPGMSLNAYFTYSIVLGRGVPWQTALGVVFLSGLLFLLLTLTNVREQIVNGIPDCLKYGTAAGIGLFIAFIGLRNANVIVANPATFVGLGKVSDPQVRLAAAGLALIAILMVRRVGSAILIGIVAITLAGIPFGMNKSYVVPGLKRDVVGYARTLLSVIPKAERLSALLSEPSQVDRINSLAKRISETDRRVLVVLDDLDRMEAKELETVFKLLRGSESFVNFTFVCSFDKAELGRILKANRPHQEIDNFLEKFFQLFVPLPPVDYAQLRDLFLERVTAVLARYSLSQDDTQKSFSKLLGEWCRNVFPQFASDQTIPKQN